MTTLKDNRPPFNLPVHVVHLDQVVPHDFFIVDQQLNRIAVTPTREIADWIVDQANGRPDAGEAGTGFLRKLLSALSDVTQTDKYSEQMLCVAEARAMVRARIETLRPSCEHDGCFAVRLCEGCSLTICVGCWGEHNNDEPPNDHTSAARPELP